MNSYTCKKNSYSYNYFSFFFFFFHRSSCSWDFHFSSGSGACSWIWEVPHKHHHVSSETTECEERACSDVQENKLAPTNGSDKIIDCEALDSILDSTPLTTFQTKNLKRQPKIFFPWKEEYLQTFPFLEKRNSDDACRLRLFGKICLEGFKAENFTRHINEGGHKKLL